MSEETIQSIVAALKTLADASRLRILGVLATGPRTGGELAELLDLRASTISHHLTRLRQVGLVNVERDGTHRIYSLDEEALSRLRTDLLVPEAMAAAVPQAEEGTWEKKVLSTFFDGSTLARIPASRKKRDVVLQWLAERFPLETPLPEAEVNERLQVHHWDSATLRRELVGGGWMERDQGIYRRVR